MDRIQSYDFTIRKTLRLLLKTPLKLPIDCIELCLQLGAPVEPVYYQEAIKRNNQSLLWLLDRYDSNHVAQSDRGLLTLARSCGAGDCVVTLQTLRLGGDSEKPDQSMDSYLQLRVIPPPVMFVDRMEQNDDRLFQV